MSDPKFKIGDTALYVGDAVTIASEAFLELSSEKRYYVILNDSDELEFVEEGLLKRWEPTQLVVQVPREVLAQWDEFSDTAVLDSLVNEAIRVWQAENA